jgi:Zn-dependent protease with chaperone function
MKQYYALFFLMFFSCSLIAQMDISVPVTAKDRLRLADPLGRLERIDKGTSFKVVGYQAVTGTNQVDYRVEYNDKPYIISSRNALEAIEIDYKNASLEDLWAINYIESDGLAHAARYGRDQELRSEIEQEYLELEQSLEQYDDPFLLDYLNQLLMRIFPGEIPKAQAANLQVNVFNGSEPWSFACSNGKIFLSTGLLATLGSEEELMAILAAEVAHIYFDHSYVNYRQQEIREARARFWTGVLTVAALAAETAVAVDNANRGNYDLLDYQFYGVFTESVFLLSSTVASSILNRLGMEYTQEQQQEADRIAKLVLEWHGMNGSAMATALARIDEYYESTREYVLTSGDSPFPNIGKRISDLEGKSDLDYTETKAEANYLQRCATLLSMSAWQEYREGELDIAQRLVDRLVDSRLAAVDDQVLRSLLLRRTTLDASGLQKALVWLDEAEQSARSIPVELYLERSVLHYRMGNMEEARKALVKYREDLLKLQPLQEKRLRWAEQMLERL